MIRDNAVYCDCCGTAKLAEIVGDNIIIKDKRHGEKHLAVISLASMIDILTANGYCISKVNKGDLVAATNRT